MGRDEEEWMTGEEGATVIPTLAHNDKTVVSPLVHNDRTVVSPLVPNDRTTKQTNKQHTWRGATPLRRQNENTRRAGPTVQGDARRLHGFPRGTRAHRLL